MSTLSKRATPRQAQVMRMVEGACRNAMHAHPEMRIPERFARSVAKRAAGTLTSAWGSVLAAPAVRQAGGETLGASPCPGSHEMQDAGRRGAAKVVRRTPLLKLRRCIGEMAGDARRADRSERLEALVEVLRLIAAEADREGMSV